VSSRALRLLIANPSASRNVGTVTTSTVIEVAHQTLDDERLLVVFWPKKAPPAAPC
jgi:hypothetical protein